MFDTDLETPVDRLEQELLAGERLIARVRTRQAALLRTLDAVQVHRHDGARSLQEWTRARLDVDETTAKDLVTAARVMTDRPELRELAETQDLSFARLVATAKLLAAGADDATVSRSLGYDLSGVARLSARRRRITRDQETKVFRDRFVATQRSLDGSLGRAIVELPGLDFAVFEQAIDERADRFRNLPGPRVGLGQRRADALVSIAQDSLDPDPTAAETGGRRLRPLVTVLVDADLAGPTRGEAGAEIAYGPRLGPNTLQAMLCEGAVRVVGLQDGRPVATSNTTDVIPPAIRDYVMWRDGGCTIAGCRSRYRLQVHHIEHRTNGGGHDPNNLTTLCWFHHHVVIHGLGYDLDPDSPPHRRQFIRRVLAKTGHDPP